MRRLWPVIQNVEEDWWSPWVFFFCCSNCFFPYNRVVGYMRNFSRSSIYLYVIFIGVAFVCEGNSQQQKKRITQTIQYTPHFILVHSFSACILMMMRSYLCEIEAKTDSDFFLLLRFSNAIFFRRQFQSEHNMFCKVRTLCAWKWGKIIHLISLNGIK